MNSHNIITCVFPPLLSSEMKREFTWQVFGVSYSEGGMEVHDHMNYPAFVSNGCCQPVIAFDREAPELSTVQV